MVFDSSFVEPQIRFHEHEISACRFYSGKMSEMTDSEKWEPKIVAFLCNWCSYAGADLAGTSRIQYPPNVRIIRVPCSGRVDPFFILASLQKGVDGVLVSGCHPGECHYLTGNYSARRKFAVLKNLLEFAGIEEARVQFSWVSASEGVRFAKVIETITEKIRDLGPSKKLVKTPPRRVLHAAGND
jgi:F420-non-reducing hydrogenase iron-sulfur subunit